MTRSRSEEARGAPPARNSRPVIAVEQGDIEKVVDASEVALIKAGLGLYQRDGRIVEISTVPAITADGRDIEVSMIAERRDHALAEDLSRAASFVRPSNGGSVPTNPPMWIVETLRERGGLKFTVLAGVVNAPTMRADGSILAVPGYDRATGLVFDPVGVDFPPIPARPTRDDALSARALLSDVIRSFPFVADVDHAVALSAILTLAVRRSLLTAPLHGFSAPVAGSGKSKLGRHRRRCRYRSGSACVGPRRD
jgi:putative DNA primase/helicase